MWRHCYSSRYKSNGIS